MAIEGFVVANTLGRLKESRRLSEVVLSEISQAIQKIEAAQESCDHTETKTYSSTLVHATLCTGCGKEVALTARP